MTLHANRMRLFSDVLSQMQADHLHVAVGSKYSGVRYRDLGLTVICGFFLDFISLSRTNIADLTRD